VISQRVLFLVPDLFGPPGGIARYCRMVCHSLIRSGLEVRVIALHDQPTGATQAAAMFPGLYYRACAGQRPTFVRQAVQSGLGGAGVVLIGHPNFAPLGLALARLMRVPASVFMYGIEVWEPLPTQRQWALRHMDQWIAISRFTAQRAAMANALPLDRIRILHNCLDPQLKTRAALLTTPQPPSLLTVSRLVRANPYKGHDYVLRALPLLLQRFPDLIYHVVGDGDRRPMLEALAADLGIAMAVRFHGNVPDNALPLRYADASVFIMPSQSEGFGFVFIEAMAQGTPAIGGNRDATPEVIVDGETGYTIDPTSVEAIVDRTTHLLCNPELRQRMGQAAACHVREMFGFGRFQYTLLSYLADIGVVTPPGSRRI